MVFMGLDGKPVSDNHKDAYVACFNLANGQTCVRVVGAGCTPWDDGADCWFLYKYIHTATAPPSTRGTPTTS